MKDDVYDSLPRLPHRVTDDARSGILKTAKFRATADSKLNADFVNHATGEGSTASPKRCVQIARLL